MKKFIATIDYIMTIIFTIVHIFFVVLTMNLSKKLHIEALSTSIQYQKILLIITIIYLIVFVFIGNPAFYKSKMKYNFRLFISFVKNVIYILNSIFIIKISSIAAIEVDSVEGLTLFEKAKELTNSLHALGINGFYVFYMCVTLIVSIIRIILWVFKLIRISNRKRKLKKKIKEKQIKAAT